MNIGAWNLRTLLAMAGALALSAGIARADIPTIDAPQLDQHTNISATKLQLIPVVSNHATADSGIHCATTTGQKGAVQNNAVTANPATGAQAVTASAPSAPTAVSAGATGSTLAAQNDGASTAAVASGVVANQQTVTAQSGAYTSQAAQAGASQTVMAAWDANTSARTQNGITLNGVIGAVNLLAQAFNTVNLASVNQASQAAGGLTYAASITGAPGACPTGMSGLGTAASPCVNAKSVCSTTQPGTAPNPGCVENRYVDSYGNVIVFLSYVQNANAALSQQVTTSLQSLSAATQSP